MLENILQLIGGIFYLLNKILFSRSERAEKQDIKNQIEILSWVSYLIGLPAWLVIFYLNRNWIAGCVEGAGGISMALGLITAIAGENKYTKPLSYLALTSIPFGIAYSLYDLRSIYSLTQIHELGIATGFLIGTYLRANKNPSGYLWFVPMHIFAGLLMYELNYMFLLVLQGLSLIFTADAYMRSLNNNTGDYNEKC